MGPIDSVRIRLSAVLGTVRLPMNRFLRMGRGAVIELNAGEDDNVQILANNVPIAHGEVTIQNNKVAVTASEIFKSAARRSATPPTLVSDWIICYLHCPGACGRGGIGRRAALRSLWGKPRGSSSLLDRTIYFTPYYPHPRGAVPSDDPGQDRAPASDAEEPHPLGELLSAGRSGGADQCLRRSL